MNHFVLAGSGEERGNTVGRFVDELAKFQGIWKASGELDGRSWYATYDAVNVLEEKIKRTSMHGRKAYDSEEQERVRLDNLSPRETQH